MKEILDRWVESTSSLRFVAVISIIFFICLSIVWVVIFLRIKYAEFLIKVQIEFLRNSIDPNEVTKLESLLVKLFSIYENKIIMPVAIPHLFKNNLSTQDKLTRYELMIKKKLSFYHNLYQMVSKFLRESEQEKGIAFSELIKEIERRKNGNKNIY
jgi:hypothetical protein